MPAFVYIGRPLLWRRSICVIFLVAFSSPLFLFSQEFTLKDYNLPDFKKSSLVVSPNFNYSGNNSRNHSTNSIRTSNNNSSKPMNLGVNVYVNYSNRLNRAHLQNNLRSYFNYNGRYTNEISENEVIYDTLFGTSRSDTTNRSVFYNGFNLSADNSTYYYFHRSLFLDLKARWDFDHSFNYSKEKLKRTSNFSLIRDTITTNSSSTSVINTASELSIGLGRIDEVQDARLAQYIIDKLLDLGTIKDKPPNEVYQQFAQKLTLIQEKRYFDFRDYQIHALEEIHHFLKDKKLISNLSISYFAHLNDLWNNGKLPIRRYGRRISAGLGITSYHQLFNSNLDALYMILRGSVEIPITDKLQVGYSGVIVPGQNVIVIEFLENFGDGSGIQFNPNAANRISYHKRRQRTRPDFLTLLQNHEFRLGYYPDTRTTLFYKTNLEIEMRFSKGKGEIGKFFKYNDDNYHSNKVIFKNQFGYYYYISPKVSLSMSYDFSYEYAYGFSPTVDQLESESRRHDFQHWARFSLGYTLF